MDKGVVCAANAFRGNGDGIIDFEEFMAMMKGSGGVAHIFSPGMTSFVLVLLPFSYPISLVLFGRTTHKPVRGLAVQGDGAPTLSLCVEPSTKVGTFFVH